jgi:hypothetical protein
MGKSKLYHAAALVLVVWYLMVPPFMCRHDRANQVEGNTVVIPQPCAYEADTPLNLPPNFRPSRS